MNDRFHIEGGRVLTAAGFRSSGLTVVGDTIESVGPRRSGGVTIDARDLIVAPGFVDLQINGGFGVDLLGNPDAMWELGRRLPVTGVTSFLPTIITAPASARSQALDAIGRRPSDHEGAEPIGLHFEGPMLSPARPGAHRSDLLVGADLDLIDGWRPEAGVALVTMAPELPGADQVIAKLVARGVVVSAGHTDATAAQARAGLEAGIGLVTHLFNAMAPFGHRDPNLVGLVLAEAEPAVGLIVDGVHVAPEAVALAWRAKGPDGLVLVTDAVAPMGRPPGRYRFAGREVIADRHRVTTDGGTLAGSVLTLDRAVRNLVEFTGCTTAQGIAAASTTPARVIGRTDRGRIESGARADLVLLNRSLEVELTICGGRVVHATEAARPRVPAPLIAEESVTRAD